VDFANKLFAVTLFVADLEESKKFYRTAFYKEVVWEDPNSAVFQFGETIINLLQGSEAPGLIGPAVVATKESGSRFQFTVQVPDVDVHAERLINAGINLVNGPVDRLWGIRTLLIADPDGHLWEFAQ